MTRILLVVCLLASPARADALEPDVEDCRNKGPGDSCGLASECVPSRCGNPVRGQWDCQRCEPSTARGVANGIAIGGAGLVLVGGVAFAYRRKKKAS